MVWDGHIAGAQCLQQTALAAAIGPDEAVAPAGAGAGRTRACLVLELCCLAGMGNRNGRTAAGTLLPAASCAGVPLSRATLATWHLTGKAAADSKS